jgi:hypothetical protein
VEMALAQMATLEVPNESHNRLEEFEHFKPHVSMAYQIATAPVWVQRRTQPTRLTFRREKKMEISDGLPSLNQKSSNSLKFQCRVMYS